MVNERFGAKELLGLLAQAVDEEGKREMASVADQLIEQGRREGERKGLVEGQRKLLLKLLRGRFGEVPEAAAARVNEADIAQLDVWAERVLSAPTLAKVLA